MKYLLSTAIACILCLSASAQWSVGPRIAYGVITQGAESIKVIPDTDRIPTTMQYTGNGSVTSVGVNFYNQLGPGFLQVEALGTKYNQQFSLLDRNSDDPLNIYNESNYVLEIPIAAGVSIGNFKLGVGPVLEVLVKKDSDLSLIDKYEDTANKIDGAFQGLVGYRFGAFNVDLRYAYKFASVVDGFAIGNDVLKLNGSANRLTVAAGVFF